VDAHGAALGERAQLHEIAHLVRDPEAVAAERLGRAEGEQAEPTQASPSMTYFIGKAIGFGR